jgi:hypothetical protein
MQVIPINLREISLSFVFTLLQKRNKKQISPKHKLSFKNVVFVQVLISGKHKNKGLPDSSQSFFGNKDCINIL